MKRFSLRVFTSYLIVIAVTLVVAGSLFLVSYRRALVMTEEGALLETARSMAILLNDRNNGLNPESSQRYLQDLSNFESLRIEITVLDVVAGSSNVVSSIGTESSSEITILPQEENLPRNPLQRLGEMQNADWRQNSRQPMPMPGNREMGDPRRNSNLDVVESSDIRFESRVADIFTPRTTVFMEIYGDAAASIVSGAASLQLVMSRENTVTNALLSAALRGYSLSSLAAIAVAALLAYFTGKRLTAPVALLAEAAGEISRGNHAARTLVRGNDEIAELGNRFNEMAQSLETRIDELARERDSLRHFLADSSHELRTPLTSLLAGTEILQEHMHSEDANLRAIIDTSHRNILRMTGLVDQLLTLSRIQGGIGSGEPGSVALSDLYSAVLREARDISLAAGLNCSVTGRLGGVDFEGFGAAIPEDFGRLRVRGDASHLVGIFRNLFDNSANAGASSLDVGVELDRGEATPVADGYRSVSGDVVIVRIRDNGRGIPAARLAVVFDRFEKGPESTGTGLGLAICSERIAGYGGNMRIASPVVDDSGNILGDNSVSVSGSHGGVGAEAQKNGRGTEVTVTLPIIIG